MKNKNHLVSSLFTILATQGLAAQAQQLPTPPRPPTQTSQKMAPNKQTQALPAAKKDENSPQAKAPPAQDIPHGQELVSIDFPNSVNLSDLIKTVGVWTGKNFILGQGVAANQKISIISAEPVTKEEAYQAFLSALNISGFTTVETGKVIKILPLANAKNSDIKTYYGESWSPATDEIINHVIPLRYIDVKTIETQLRPLLGTTQFASFSTTNSLILTDTGNRIRRLLEVIKLLDQKTNQSQVSIVPVNYIDAQDTVKKVLDIFGSGSTGSAISLQKAFIDERTNSVILVGPAAALDDIVRFINRLDKPAADPTSQTLIRVRPLDYADAEKLAQTLQALSQNSIAGSKSHNPYEARPPYMPPLPNRETHRGEHEANTAADLAGAKITADKSTNSLIIQGSKSAYEAIDSIISQLDKRRAQVYIEANIIDINIQNGLDWQPSALGGHTVGNGLTLPFGFSVGNALPFVTNQSGTSATAATSLGSIGSSAVLGILSNKSINIGGFSLSPGALIFALKSDSNTNVLQTPSMMVSDNEDANFKYATEWNTVLPTANPNGTGGIVSQTQKYDATTSLKVTPQISRSDYVNLKINLQLDDAGAPNADTGFPNPIYKRSAESVVTVQNEQSAVLGGITQNSVKNSEAKVPLLGDVPIVGWLFKQVKNIKQKTNLILLVTPHVVRSADDLARIYEKKIHDRDAFLRAFYGEKFKQEGGYSQMPTLEDGKARPERVFLDESYHSAQSENNSTSSKANHLPSQETEPINAPSSQSGGNLGGPHPAPPSHPSQPYHAP